MQTTPPPPTRRAESNARVSERHVETWEELEERLKSPQHQRHGHAGAYAPPCAGLPPARGGRAPGLSTPHISPHEPPFVLITHIGGTFTKLKGQGTDSGGGLRGEVTGFSDASRKRLQRKMASINEGRAASARQFITLTYPGQYPACGRTWKRDLDAFLKRMFRVGDVQAVVWKLEPQKRGAPHFHLLVLATCAIERPWVAQAWYEIVGSGRMEHLMAGTQCDTIRDWRGVLSYASKYIGKVVQQQLPDYWKSAGRWWGVRGKLPIDPESVELTKKEGCRIRRVMKRYLEKKLKTKLVPLRLGAGLCVFMSPDDAYRLVDWVQLDNVDYERDRPPTAASKLHPRDLPY